MHFDTLVIERNIEHTRFPVPEDETHADTADYPGLVRAADLIGQLADVNYLRKIPALFAEFNEIGTNKKLGYRNPADLRGVPTCPRAVFLPLAQPRGWAFFNGPHFSEAGPPLSSTRRE